MKRALRTFAALVGVILALAAIFYANPIGVNDRLIRVGLWCRGVRSEYVQVDGNRIHYFEALPPSGIAGTPLVLIHGLGSRGEDWAPLIAPLAAAGFHVYVPDLLGYGRSPRPDVDYSISLEENLVGDFIHALQIPKTDLAGWSMGGWVAAKLTLDHPEMVDRLVLYDSVGIYFPPSFPADIFTPNDQAGLDRLVAILDPHPAKIPEFVARAELARLKENAWVVSRSTSAMTSGRDLLDFRLSGLRRPTLIVWGSVDTLIPPSVGESMHHLIPDSSFELIEGCGHLAPVQCRHSALAATVEFLKSQPPLRGVERTLPGN
jgi:pimeloyl-ACP methyl ester carboxylesterase